MYPFKPFHIKIYCWNSIWKTSTKNCPYFLFQALKPSMYTAFHVPIPHKPFREILLKFSIENFQEVALNHSHFQPSFQQTLLTTLCAMLFSASCPCLHKAVNGTSWNIPEGEECLCEVCLLPWGSHLLSTLFHLHQTMPITYLVTLRFTTWSKCMLKFTLKIFKPRQAYSAAGA